MLLTSTLRRTLAIATSVTLGVITAALVAACVWRQMQFAAFLELEWMGTATLCAAQLALFAFPAAWGYLGVRDNDDVYGPILVGGILANLLFGSITAVIQFGFLEFATVTHTLLPFLAALAVSGVVYMLGRYKPGVGIVL